MTSPLSFPSSLWLECTHAGRSCSSSLGSEGKSPVLRIQEDGKSLGPQLFHPTIPSLNLHRGLLCEREPNTSFLGLLARAAPTCLPTISLCPHLHYDSSPQTGLLPLARLSPSSGDTASRRSVLNLTLSHPCLHNVSWAPVKILTLGIPEPQNPTCKLPFPPRLLPRPPLVVLCFCQAFFSSNCSCGGQPPGWCPASRMATSDCHPLVLTPLVLSHVEQGCEANRTLGDGSMCLPSLDPGVSSRIPHWEKVRPHMRTLKHPCGNVPLAGN